MDTPSYTGSSGSDISVSSSEPSAMDSSEVSVISVLSFEPLPMGSLEDGNDDLLDELLDPCEVFTTRVITVEAGEDVSHKIIEFCEQVPGHAVCIMSAFGELSEITLNLPLPSVASVTYEGQFTILTLSGSFTPTCSEGSERMGGLSLTFSHGNASVVGGRVAGQLKAATSVMITVASFLPSFD